MSLENIINTSGAEIARVQMTDSFHEKKKKAKRILSLIAGKKKKKRKITSLPKPEFKVKTMKNGKERQKNNPT